MECLAPLSTLIKVMVTLQQLKPKGNSMIVKNLKEKQIQAAILLMQGKTGREVATELNITPETVSHWRANPEFEAFMNELRLDVIKSARDSLKNLSVKATRTLEDLLEKADSDAVRLKAALAILAMAGHTDPRNGLWAWGIGSTNPDNVAEEQENEKLKEKMMINVMSKAF